MPVSGATVAADAQVFGKQFVERMTGLGKQLIGQQPEAAATARMDPLDLVEVPREQIEAFSSWLGTRAFSYETDMGCLYRSTLGALHINATHGIGLTPAEDAAAAALVIKKHDTGGFHAAIAMREPGVDGAPGAIRVLDAETGRLSSMSLDQWAGRKAPADEAAVSLPYDQDGLRLHSAFGRSGQNSKTITTGLFNGMQKKLHAGWDNVPVVDTPAATPRTPTPVVEQSAQQLAGRAVLDANGTPARVTGAVLKHDVPVEDVDTLIARRQHQLWRDPRHHEGVEQGGTVIMPTKDGRAVALEVDQPLRESIPGPEAPFSRPLSQVEPIVERPLAVLDGRGNVVHQAPTTIMERAQAENAAWQAPVADAGASAPAMTERVASEPPRRSFWKRLFGRD